MNKYENGELRIGVIGAGIIGLSCAVEFQEKFPDAEIQVIADAFLSDTTSSVAAGVWSPGIKFRGPSLEITKKWLFDSYQVYNGLLTNNPVEAAHAGILKRGVYNLSSKSAGKTRNPFMEELIPEFRLCSRSEIATLSCGKKYQYGSYCPTILTSCKRYLPYLVKKFESNDGTLVKRKVTDFKELTSENFDLVFNCTGLGSQTLCNDTLLTPMRGQVFKVDAPWITNFYEGDNFTYIYPDLDSVTIGGTKQFNLDNTEFDKYDAQSIWERCTNLLPSLKDAKIIQECVGFRPHRPFVRVEKEIMRFDNGKSLKMIHNYGHGSYGVMSAPGTSKYAVELGMQLLNTQITSKL